MVNSWFLSPAKLPVVDSGIEVSVCLLFQDEVGKGGKKVSKLMWSISVEGLMLKLKLQYFGHLMQKTDSFEKALMLGKIEGGGGRGTTEDEMVGWHHWLNGHEFE